MSNQTMSSSEFFRYLLECRNYLELAGEIAFDAAVGILHDAYAHRGQTDYLTAWEVYETAVTAVNPGQTDYYLPTPEEFLDGVKLLRN